MKPRRILYVTDGFAPFVIGGMQSYARRQLELLAAAGHELISISGRETSPVPADLGWRNIALPWPRRGLRRFSPWRYVDDLKAFSAAVAAVADEVRPELIYSEGPLLHAWLRRSARPAPAIFNPHGLEMFQDKGSRIENLKSWPLRAIVADHARRADRTVCLSRGSALMRILTERIGVPPARIAVVPNAAPAEAAAEPRAAAPGGRRRFLFVGRDEPRKALPLLLDAFRGIEGAELDVVGAEARPGAPPHVRFHGPVRDRAAVRGFYARADFLVAPSHAEGLPTVILEAFAAALPVIATDVGANADPVRDGETGFLIARADRGALERAIRAATALPDAAYAALSRNCLAAARGRFSPESAGEKLLALVEEVAGAPQPAGFSRA